MGSLIFEKGTSPLEVLEGLVISYEMFDSSPAVFNALVRACTQAGVTEGAYDVINKLRNEGFWVTIHACNNFLNHLLKLNEIGRFWNLYEDMVSYGYMENVNTFNLGGNYPNVVSFNMVVDGGCKSSDLDLAVKLIKKMRIISKHFSGAKQLLGSMYTRGLIPDTVTYGTLIDGYCKQGNTGSAVQIYEGMSEEHQEAVVNGRPFSETLVEVLYSINEHLQTEDIDAPLTNIRPVKKAALVVVTGDRGLCGGFNNPIIKKAEARISQLKDLGLDYTVISVGNLPTAKDPQAIADDVFSLFISEEVDKVELLYTKFVSLVRSEPVIHTLLPLSLKGEICDINGNCVDAAEDEFFRTQFRFLILCCLYLNSQILRSLQESLANELAARMTAVSNATDNAVELKKTLSRVYNRQRQAKITGEILEIVAGADALTWSITVLCSSV
ncbi:ATP synthase gamma chain like [Quillaja saponaria]|uniref:F-ATPase gamma subunit n=1 Tax=Quillaja saponaria TaxID=32244 RepID=A0AAD7PUH2_QUISA|nr:ATP synthase gamma chain like [Quillaja saponaria]